jgi:hypothetical protein
MTDLPKWRGLSALVRDLVVHGSEAIETVQLETMRRPIAVISKLAAGAAPAARAVEWIHDLTVTTTHRSIRGAARIVDRAVEVGLELAGERARL